MAVTYGFFNSLDGDRVYNADQMSRYFEGLVSNGIYPNVGGALQVLATTNLTVAVQSGRAIIDCKWLRNDAAYTVEISPAHVILPRYTAVVIRLDYDYRTITITTIDGTPASTPTKPAMTNTGTVKELCLAYVYVAAGATTITQANIVDMRASSSCGWVTGVVQQVNTATLFAQWQAAYEEYYAAMQAWQAQAQADFQTWFTALTQELTVNTYIVRYTKTVTLSTGSSTAISLDMTGYSYQESDIIDVFINGLLAQPETDYTLDTSGAVPTVTPVATKAGTVITVHATQSRIGYYSLETDAGDLLVTAEDDEIGI